MVGWHIERENYFEMCSEEANLDIRKAPEQAAIYR